jgi:hypothetical protein
MHSIASSNTHGDVVVPVLWVQILMHLVYSLSLIHGENVCPLVPCRVLVVSTAATLVVSTGVGGWVGCRRVLHRGWWWRSGRTTTAGAGNDIIQQLNRLHTAAYACLPAVQLLAVVFHTA